MNKYVLNDFIYKKNTDSFITEIFHKYKVENFKGPNSAVWNFILKKKKTLIRPILIPTSTNHNAGFA